MKPKSQVISWVLQLCIIALLAPAAYFKLAGHEASIKLFTDLGMEPTGRYIIGFLEAAACVLLLMPNTAVHGAILSLGIMVGAVIAHSSRIGFNDMFAYFAIVLVLCSSAIIYLRRKQIKSISRMLN
ncbi:MAG: putative membrane protein YphA (DoxX/SURF4 family) [Cryomorphaceae bacterium]|jgi:uncharacterized membrane protein YphA (DoxX/SURF4 family)